MLNFYNLCCEILIKDYDCVFESKQIGILPIRIIQKNSVGGSYNRKNIAFKLDGAFCFSIGMIYQTNTFYILNDGSTIDRKIDLNTKDEMDSLSDTEKVLIYGRSFMDKTIAKLLKFDDETDKGFIELLEFLKNEF